MSTINKCITLAFEEIEQSKVRTEVGLEMITVSEAKRIIENAIQCTEVELQKEQQKTYKEAKQHY